MAISKIQLRSFDMLILAFQDSGIRGCAGAGRTVSVQPRKRHYQPGNLQSR